ncbi:periplasmic heavy metal sensor [Altericroceibacterium spongiae]|uniref:Periplasmic heavy metal sensor n=1 Tax=Altericroceibacterium spongiae TaxID=2320269 RepID=A0A420EQ16_9SPHN|nr:periplasmic heavy metal sensor [Altericroceibacterium spongiae]
MSAFHIVLAILLAAAAGCLGALAATQWSGEKQSGGGLHDFVHEELDLTPDQNARLNVLEDRFENKRIRLESTLRAANVDLATAMEAEHSYGPKVAAAIDRVHAQMGELQKATVRHVFAMRELLNEQQRKKFDRQISVSLTGTGRK